jgi:hypothetical protein
MSHPISIQRHVPSNLILYVPKKIEAYFDATLKYLSSMETESTRAILTRLLEKAGRAGELSAHQQILTCSWLVGNSSAINIWNFIQCLFAINVNTMQGYNILDPFLTFTLHKINIESLSQLV